MTLDKMAEMRRLTVIWCVFITVTCNHPIINAVISCCMYTNIHQRRHTMLLCDVWHFIKIGRKSFKFQIIIPTHFICIWSYHVIYSFAVCLCVCALSTCSCVFICTNCSFWYIWLYISLSVCFLAVLSSLFGQLTDTHTHTRTHHHVTVFIQLKLFLTQVSLI